MSEYRIAIDIGGTFTDVVLVDDATGERWTGKVLSTPADPSQGFFRALDTALGTVGSGSATLTQVLHATTVATNAVITRSGGPAALIATEGFRDVLEIARQIRHDLYDLRTTKPEPLIPRARAYEVRERLRHDGTVHTPLDEESVRRAAVAIRAAGVRSVAVCLLHAYVNPAHEERVAAILRDEIPDVVVSLSSRIAPEIREYPRASTTVANAYIMPVVRRYLAAIESGLCDRGTAARLWLMKSNGGIATAAGAIERPVDIIESGPAAGLAAAAHYAGLVGSADVVSLDMGGTTAKVGMIERGETRQIQGWELGATTGSGAAVAHASGLPILGSVVDLVEIGAGGGSIAWIDAGGILRVGPRSAGADPGPACYGRGGADPTVTDANLVLGRIGAAPLAGGRLPLDPDAAATAIGRLAERLGVTPLEAAVAIVDVADSAMAGATRLMTVRRGLDPAGFDLLAFGGAGPLHACRQAAELGFRSVIVPPEAGVLSAFGLLASAPRVDHRAAFRRRLDTLRPEEADAALERLEHEALERMPPDVVGDGVRRERAVDMRYVGQSWDLRVAIPEGPFDAHAQDRLRRDFDALHERTYGYASPAAPVETVHLAVTIAAPRPTRAAPAMTTDAPPAAVPGGFRPAFAGGAGLVPVPVHRWGDLAAGQELSGPAVIDGPDSTVYVAPGFRVRVGPLGVLRLTVAGAAG